MTNKHYFSVELAKVVGVNAAILHNHIKYWCDKNKENNINFIDGHYWTYQTLQDFQEVFTYLGKFQIKSSIVKLKDEKYIDSRQNIGKNKWDKTLYYRILKEASFDEEKNLISKTNEVDVLINESDNNKQIVNNNEFLILLKTLQEKSPIKSKIRNDQSTHKAFLKIEDKSSVAEDYIYHQNKEGQFAKNLTSFLLDYSSFETERVILWA